MKRVVITGMGVISPIGNNLKETWEGIKNKKCGVDEITQFDTSTFKTKLACEVKNYDPNDYFNPKQVRHLDRSTQLAMIAAKEALENSKITPENTDYNNIGTYISSGIGGLNTIQTQCAVGCGKGYNRISPMFLPMGLANMQAGNVTIDLGFKGASFSIVSACASSTHAIGEAYRAIKAGYEEVIFAGGTESAVCEVGVASFENMKALSNATEKNRASIPFDKERSGFVMGEGSAVVVLEELEHALKRGATIYGEVVGYGATSDAYHVTSPSPDGEGAARAMVRSMKDAGVEPKDIDYVNAHGTATHLNDMYETMAIKTAFGESAKSVMVSSTKGNVGHLLGAAGAIEAIFCTMAIQDSFVPPTINYKVPDEDCDLDIVPNEPRHKDLNYVMSNSLGFGGHNASIIIKKYNN